MCGVIEFTQNSFRFGAGSGDQVCVPMIAAGMDHVKIKLTSEGASEWSCWIIFVLMSFSRSGVTVFLAWMERRSGPGPTALCECVPSESHPISI